MICCRLKCGNKNNSTMADRLNITLEAGEGTAETLTMAAAVTGGVNNEYESQPKSEGLKTDLAKADIKIKGPAKDAKTKDVKLFGLVEGGIGNKVKSQDTKANDQGQGARYKMDSVPRDELTKVWKKLNFEVKSFDDSEADVMETRIKKLAKMEHKAHDCVVVIFLTHGRDGAVQGSDNEWLEVSTITSYFKASACPSLANKPKLFFFQSCRGKDIQKAVPVQGDDGGSAPAATEIIVQADKMVAPEADFFFCFATVAGTQALRNTETGSWFIQALVQSLQESTKSDDLDSIMTAVRQKVNDHQVETVKGEFLRQTAETKTTLLKKVYF
ncbi:caspase-8-like isoform X3 [Haliotis rufescens]|uniref:caspase-8-like isoform X3 n=1 Tax=Haliotis rufescens TaxID=6454 RepID=UPI00201ED08F|nr:caspase-8-like isoform X3 [Haliotis rufescens]